jgi:hypothetical protein
VSIAALAAATLIKWFPALVLPVFLRRIGWKHSAWFVALCLLGALPFSDAGWQLFSGVVSFAKHWRNNASLFDLLAAATGSERAATGIAAAALAGLSLWLAWKRSEPLRASFLLVAALLLLTPSIFPWYVTWLIPFLCFFPNPAFLLWTSTVLLSYHVLIDYVTLGIWHYDSRLIWLEYLPVFALLLWRGWRGYRLGG